MTLGQKCEKSTAMYEKTNQLMEKISKIVYFFIVFVCVPGFVIPKICVSYFNYFTTNLGNDAFELSEPIW